MLKWVSNNSILANREGQPSTTPSPRVEKLRRTVGALSILGAKVEEDVPKVVFTSCKEEEEKDADMEELPLTPLKDPIVTKAMSSLSLEFPFAGRFINSPSVDSGVGSRSSKSSLFTNAARILESPFRTFDDVALLNYSPSSLSNLSLFSLDSRAPFSQMIELLSIMITLPCITRFPVAVAKHGGVAFILAYTVVLGLLGFPSMYLQHNLARLEQKGPVQLWYSLVPVSSGLGTALATLSLLMTVQYSVITSQSIMYLISSFYSPLPWTQCSAWWNADSACQDHHPVADFLSEVEKTLNISLADRTVKEGEPAYQQFWFRYILSGGSSVNTKLVLALLCLWVAIGFIVLVGYRSVLSRLQASLMVLVGTITTAFLVKLFTLPDILPVISSTLSPTWSSLSTTSCWQEAVLLCSLSANIHTGSVQAVASRSNSRHDHSLILLASLVIHLLVSSVWSIITLALVRDITSLPSSLFPLALTGEALSKVSGGAGWCQAWYSLTIMLGVMSMLSSLLGPLSYAQTKHKTVIRTALCLGITVPCLFISIVCTIPSAPYILSLLSRWGIYFPSILLATITTTTLTLAYGLSRATDRIAAQDGRKMHLALLRYLQVTGSILPLLLIYFSFSYLPITSLASNSSNLSTWAEPLGWLMTLLVLSQVVFGAILVIVVSLKSSSPGVLSWRDLLGCSSFRSTRQKLVKRSRLSSSSYRNFERCDITLTSDLGTPSRHRVASSKAGLVNRRLSLSPRTGGS